MLIMSAYYKTVRFRFPLLRKHLFVTDKPYVMRRSYADGESDLLRLAQKSHDEAHWLHPRDKSLWYNLRREGKKECSNGKIEIGCRYDPLDYSQFGATLADYHTHPGFFQELFERELMNSKPETDAECIKKIAANHVRLPSTDDVEGCMEIIQLASREIDLDFVIVSPYGFTTTSIKTYDPELPKRYDSIYIQAICHEALESGGKNTGMDFVTKYINDSLPSISLSFRAR